MLSEATFDQLIELPGAGPILIIEGGRMGERYRVFATQHWGSRLGGHGQFRK